MLNQLVDGVFLINMDQHADRLAAATQAFQQIGETFERFPGCAVNGGASYSDRVAGCRKSHIEILKLARDRGYRSVAVFEDDIEFAPNFMARLPEVQDFIQRNAWQLMYLGGSHYKDQHEMVQPNVSRVRNTFTTHAYFAHSSIYDAVISQEKTSAPIDNIYVQGIQAAGRSYCIRPNIAFQRAGRAYISGNLVDYHWIREGQA